MRAQRREALWPGALQQKRAESTSCRCSNAINYLAIALAYLSVTMQVCKRSGMHRDQYSRYSNNHTIPVSKAHAQRVYSSDFCIRCSVYLCNPLCAGLLKSIPLCALLEWVKTTW